MLLKLFDLPETQALTGNQVEVVAIVKPIREIVINQQGQINEIISNTAKSVTPTVWLNKVGHNQLSMTAVISTEYQNILKNINPHKSYGIIYNRSSHELLSSLAKHVALKLKQDTSSSIIYSALLQKI